VLPSPTSARRRMNNVSLARPNAPLLKHGRCTRASGWPRGASIMACAASPPMAERPALRAALVALRQDNAGVFVVAKRDRIARHVVLAASITGAVALEGARVVSVSGEGNGDSPADAFIRTVIDGAAQYEHGLIRSRTCAALAAKRARGERIGSVPLGFALDADGVRLVVDKREQATIARARELRASRLSLRAVAARLTAEGHLSRAGRQFLAQQVSRMVSQSARGASRRRRRASLH
jgi:DNA invertase Pin-like site-specific DNA recombinase